MKILVIKAPSKRTGILDMPYHLPEELHPFISEADFWFKVLPRNKALGCEKTFAGAKG
jgi:hypothetical protein